MLYCRLKYVRLDKHDSVDLFIDWLCSGCDIVGVMCMPASSKFLIESTGEKLVKIGQYLAKIWSKYDSLLFGPPCICM